MLNVRISNIWKEFSAYEKYDEQLKKLGLKQKLYAGVEFKEVRGLNHDK